MKLDGTSPFICLAVVALIAALSGLLSVRHLRLSGDSYQYALVSREIAAGRGLVVPLIEPDSHPDAAGRVPFTVQPPALPLALAVLSGVEPGRLWPAQALNILCIIAIGLCTWGICRQMMSRTWATAVAIMVVTATPLMRTSHYLWSEPMFIAWTMLSLLLLGHSRHSRLRTLWLLCGGLAAAAALATRFAGIFLLAVFFWEALVVWRRRGLPSAIVTLAATAWAPLAAAAMIFLRNIRTVGNIRGFNPPDPGRSILESIGGVLRMAFETDACLGLIVLGVGLLVLSWPRKTFPRAKAPASLRRLWKRDLDLPIVAMAAYLALIVAAMYRYQPVFEGRFFAPCWPLILVCLVAVTLGVLGASRGAEVRAKGKWTLAVCAIACVAIFVNDDVRRFSKPDAPEYRTDELVGWLSRKSSDRSALAGNVAALLAFETGRPCLLPTNRTHNKFVKLPKDVLAELRESMTRIGARYMVLATSGKGLDAADWGDGIASLSRRENTDRSFTCVFNCKDGLIYELQPQGK